MPNAARKTMPLAPVPPVPQLSKPADIEDAYKLNYSHHHLARLVASGERKNVVLSLKTGFAVGTISTLKSAPSFRSLVAFYRRAVDETWKKIFADKAQLLSTTGDIALQEVKRRLAEDPDQFTAKELLEVIRSTYDRSGFGPQTKVEIDETQTIRIIGELRQRFGLSRDNPRETHRVSAVPSAKDAFNKQTSNGRAEVSEAGGGEVEVASSITGQPSLWEKDTGEPVARSGEEKSAKPVSATRHNSGVGQQDIADRVQTAPDSTGA